jgi:hypothetical protein
MAYASFFTNIAVARYLAGIATCAATAFRNIPIGTMASSLGSRRGSDRRQVGKETGTRLIFRRRRPGHSKSWSHLLPGAHWFEVESSLGHA